MPINVSTPPPRKTATPRKVTSKTAARGDDKSLGQQRYEGIRGIGQALQLGLVMSHQYADAGCIGQHWNPFASAVAEAADDNVWVAKISDSLIQSGPLMGIVTAAIPMALQFAANHGFIDASKVANMGVVAPEALEAKMKADMAKQAMEAMRMQREAEEELRAMMVQANGDEPTVNLNGNAVAS